MIGFILGVVGLAGGGGIAALIAKFGLSVVMGKARAGFGRVPRWAWITLAIALAVVAIVIWHGRQVARHDKALTAAVTAQVNAAWAKRFDQMRIKADDVRRKAEALGRNISTKLKDQHDAQIRHNAADADDLRLHGPGRAAATGCRPGNYPGVSARPGRPGGPGGGSGAAAGALPADDRLALVPWSWLVDEAQQADDSRAEVLTWRNWYALQAGAWERMRSPPPKPSTSTKGTTDGR